MSATQSNEAQSTNNEELVKYITNQEDLELAFVEAGRKLVVLSFFLLGNKENERMLQFLAEKATTYRNSIVLLTVDVAKSGQLAKTCEALQIPWFIFLRDAKKIEAYHSINCHRIGNTIRSCLGEEKNHTLKTYVKNASDLNKRLVDAKDRLVLLAFMIPGDESGERLNIDLDEIEERNQDTIYVFKVDVDTCKDLTTNYHIQGVPTIVFIKKKRVLEQISALEMDKLGQVLTKFTKMESENAGKDAGSRNLFPSIKSHSKTRTSSPEKESNVTSNVNPENSSVQ